MTISINQFEKMAIDAANKNALPLSKDDEPMHVSFEKWPSNPLPTCRVCYYMADGENYTGVSPDPSEAIGLAITAYKSTLNNPVELTL
jgi:hypothetical protein